MVNWPFGKSKGMKGDQPGSRGDLGIQFVRRDGKDLDPKEWKVPIVFQYRPSEMTFSGPEGTSDRIFNDLSGSTVTFTIAMKEIPANTDVVHVQLSADLLKRFVADAL